MKTIISVQSVSGYPKTKQYSDQKVAYSDIILQQNIQQNWMVITVLNVIRI